MKKKVAAEKAAKASPAVARPQKRREQKEAQTVVDIKKQLREKSVDELKLDIADIYIAVERSQAMEQQAQAMAKQAHAMRAAALENISVRREIIAEKG